MSVITDYIYDKEIHVLNKEYAYILGSYDKDLKQHEINEELDEFFKKYCAYLIENDKQKVVEYLMKIFRNYLSMDKLPEDTSMNYLSPWSTDILSQRASLSLKFKRKPNDNLRNCDNSTS